MARLRFAIAIFLLIAAGRYTQAEPPAESPDSSQESVESAAQLHAQKTVVAASEVRRLVRQLGGSSFAERQFATERLATLCPEAFDVLAECYRTSDDFETRIRIQDLVERAFFDSRLLQQSGFLGVQLQTLNSDLDPRLGPGRGAVHVHMVVEGTAAARADLREGDVIFEVEGRPFSEDLRTDEFSNLIRDAGPDARLNLSVFREGSVQPIVVPVTLGARPLKYYDEGDNAQRLEDTTQEFRRWWAEKFEGQDPASLAKPKTSDND